MLKEALQEDTVKKELSAHGVGNLNRKQRRALERRMGDMLKLDDSSAKKKKKK